MILYQVKYQEKLFTEVLKTWWNSEEKKLISEIDDEMIVGVWRIKLKDNGL